MEIAKNDMTRENFSIGAFYNITKKDNTVKTVGGDSFFYPQNP